MTGNTQLLGLALPVDGGLDGTWGDVVNDSITSLVDSAVAGTTTLSADADVTLTTTVLAANQARQAILRWTASNGATTRNITAPAQSKPYIVINAGTGSIVLRGVGPTTGITIVSGERCVAAWSGADFVKVSTSIAGTVTSVVGTGTVNGISLSGTVTSSGNLTLGGALSGVSLATQVTGTLPIANGGTGATTRQDAMDALAGAVTSGQYLRGNGTDVVMSAIQVADVPTLNQNTTGTAANVTGTVAIANGGTGATTLAGANIPVFNAANTFTGTQTFSGTSSAQAIILNDAAEVATISATAATGTIAYDITTQSVLFYTTNASANWTVNFRASSGTSLNTLMSTGQSMTAAFLVTQGSTAYFNSAVQVDGTTSGVTTRWQGGTAPAAGNASGIDVYTYTIIKTGSATFTVLASLTRFA
jgi:hypothetical protein